MKRALFAVVALISLSVVQASLAMTCPGSDASLSVAGFADTTSFTGRNAPAPGTSPTGSDCVRAWNSTASQAERRSLTRLHVSLARISTGGMGNAAGVHGPTCQISLAVPESSLTGLKVSGQAKLAIGGPWKHGSVPEWWGGISCGSLPDAGGESIPSGLPIETATVTSGGLLRIR